MPGVQTSSPSYLMIMIIEDGKSKLFCEASKQRCRSDVSNSFSLPIYTRSSLFEPNKTRIRLLFKSELFATQTHWSVVQSEEWEFCRVGFVPRICWVLFCNGHGNNNYTDAVRNQSRCGNGNSDSKRKHAL
eukprot:4651106-Amphidinium_carterae.1